jgi:hypothetical protein
MELNWTTPKQTAEQWSVTERQVQSLCAQGKISDAVRIGRSWLIPKGAPRPLDGRTKAAKQLKAGKKRG